MTLRYFALLAAAIFALMALIQLIRAFAGWPITIGVTEIPLWPSWLAVVVLGGLAVVGFTSARR